MMSVPWIFTDDAATWLYAVVAGVFWVTTILSAIMAWNDRQAHWVWVGWFFMMLTLVTVAISQLRNPAPVFPASVLYVLMRVAFILLAGGAVGLCGYLAVRLKMMPKRVMHS